MESIFSKLKSYFSRLNGMGGREGEGVAGNRETVKEGRGA